jgi:hypothetical protein
LSAEHLLALLGAELHAHRVELLDAHAVLAGDGAAHRDAGLQDVGAEQLAAVQLVGVVGVEQDQRVQVAVAGVEDVAAAQAVLLLHRGDREQHVGQALARDGRVHAHVVGADAPAAGKAFLRPLQNFSRSASFALTSIAVAPQPSSTRACARSLLGHLLGRAVALAQQDRGASRS